MITENKYNNLSQGNVRTVLDQSRNLVERNEYYPYGGLINASDNQLQPYKYSSKELDRENGLDLYDSQARWFDPMLPQTTTQDPLAEKYFSISPYTWCAGNPVRFVDPSGMVIAYHENGRRYTYKMMDGEDWGFYDEYNKMYKGDSEFLHQLETALAKLLEKTYGYMIVTYLVDIDNVINISYGSNGLTKNTDTGEYDLTWNPNGLEGGIDVNNNIERPSFIGLSHELGHTFDKINNVVFGIWCELSTTTNSKYLVSNSEKVAIAWENAIREEHHIPLRSHYSYYENYTPNEDTRAIDAKNNYNLPVGGIKRAHT